MWSSSLTAKLSRSRVAPRSTWPWILRRTVRSRARARCTRSARRPRSPAVRREVEELATVAAGGDVNDDVELLAGGLERALDAGVEAGRDDQLLRQRPLAQQRRQLRKPGVERRRLDVPVEREVQLVVERPDAVSRRDRLRDVGEPAPVRRRARSGPRAGFASSSTGDAGRGRAEDGHEPPGRERAHHLVVVVFERRRCDPHERRAPGAGSTPYSAWSSGPGSIPSSSTSVRRASW